MRSAHVAVICLLAMTVMIPMAKAQTSAYILVQTAKPIAPSYPGVNANILGLRIGMTVSQAKAIAAKRFPGSKSQEFKSAVSTDYRGSYVSSQSYVSRVDVRYGPSDLLRLYFTNPATGNVLYGMTLTIFYPDVSKAPLMTAAWAALIKQYGPPSAHNGGTWQFGEHSLKPCPILGCVDLGVAAPGMYKRALQLGVVLEIDASLGPSRTNNTKVGWTSAGMEDYQVKNESVNAADKQLNTLATAYYNKIAAAQSEAEQKLKKNATNVLDVTGAVTGHALVTGCRESYGNGLYAKTFASADAVEKSLFITKYLSEAIIQKYPIGPVTYAGKKYNMTVTAFGQPPSTTDANVQLSPVNGKGTVIGGWGAVVKGSITIADSGSSRAVTFDHAVLNPSPNQRNAPSGPVTINGKAYCKGGGEPLPPELFVPAQALTGNYTATHVSPNGKKTAVWMEFVSNTAVNIESASQKVRTTYKFNGSLLLIGNMQGRTAKIDSNGCFDFGDFAKNAKFCKTTAPTPSAMKAMEIKQAQEKAAAIAAAKKKEKALEMMPKF
jgi:hypothetical protein